MGKRTVSNGTVALILSGLSVVVVLVLGIQYTNSRRPEETGNTVPPSSPAAISTSPAATPSPSPTPTVSAEKNIQVFAPQTGQAVSASFSANGQARVFENVLQVRLVNQNNGKILFSQPVQAQASDIGRFGNFSVQVQFNGTDAQSGDRLLLEAFQYSPKDGAEVDKIAVPLTYQP